MSHANGGENTKLLTITAGIQRNACCDSAGVVKTVTRPTPKMTALTITKISAATRRRALLSLVIFGSFFASITGQLFSSPSGSLSSFARPLGKPNDHSSQKRRIDALDKEATILHRLNVVRDLARLARGDIGISVAATLSKLLAAGLSSLSLPRITILIA